MFNNTSLYNVPSPYNSIMIERHYMNEETYRRLYLQPQPALYSPFNYQMPITTQTPAPVAPVATPRPATAVTAAPTTATTRPTPRLNFLDLIFNLTPMPAENNEPTTSNITPQILNSNSRLEVFHSALSSENNNENICPICFDELVNNTIVRTLNTCGHSFHYVCFDRWITNNLNCPVCRRNIGETQTRNTTTTTPEEPSTRETTFSFFNRTL
jgi:hypothetical protein